MSITIPRIPAMRIILLVLAALLLLAAAVASSPDSAVAKNGVRTCDVDDKERDLGPTYVTQLKVRSTSCRQGERVIKGWYECRLDNGGRDGECDERIRGYKCKESRRNEIDTQFDATVSCRKGERGYIKHRYTQFT